MFTGIIESIGKIIYIKKILDITKITVHIKISHDLQTGQSVSLNGTCLTISNILNNNCTFDLTKETIQRTTFKNIKINDLVNVERSLKLGNRLDGHFVLGHIDCTTTIIKLKQNQNETKFWFKIPPQISKFISEKGSISIDGISLTIVDVSYFEFSVCLIPETLKITTFNTKKIGDSVNIEIDIIAKYLHKLNTKFTGNYQ